MTNQSKSDTIFSTPTTKVVGFFMGNEVIINVLPLFTSFLLSSDQATSSSTFASTLPVTTLEERRVWLVKDKQTLEDIAKEYYGKKQYWTILWNDNADIDNPNVLQTGSKLKLRVVSPVLFEDLRPELVKKQEVLKKKNNQPQKQFVIRQSTYSIEKPIVQAQALITSNYDTVYKEAGQKYGIPWEILYGIHLTETGCRDGEIYNAQGSGAQGPMQFMPGTWGAYGVDGDGDGIANINDVKDAIFGAANFLAKHGSLEAGLRSYGGNTSGVLAAARTRGLSL